MAHLLAMVAALLVTGAPAHAVPRFEVDQEPTLGAVAAIGVGYSQGTGDPPPMRIAIRVPEAYRFTPDAGGVPPGTMIGSDLVYLTPELGFPATGLVTSEDPTAFGREAAACGVGGPVDAVWAAHIGSTRGVIPIPIFVQGRVFVVCPDAAALGATAAAIGFQLGFFSDFARRELIGGPGVPGTFVWSALLTRPGLPEVELRSLITLPQRARFAARVRQGRVRIRGRVTADGGGIGGVRIQADIVRNLRRGFEPALYGSTRADGRFTIVQRVRRGTFYVRVRAYSDPRDVTATACAGASAPGGCVSATQSGFGLEATPAAVRIHS
jgi:hypothetical protein